jgi:hypothetical protein
MARTGATELTFQAFGVRARVTAPREYFDCVLALLPPGSQRCAATGLNAALVLTADANGVFEIIRDGRTFAGGLSRDIALEVLERELHSLVAFRAPDHVFVHAGVVAHGGVAVVLPGTSFAGKTTLVAALVHAGAEYYSDEFAPIDRDGLVHPFAKPLSLRDHRAQQIAHHVDALGGIAGENPLRIGAIVFTSYNGRTTWAPRPLTHGEGTLALLSHTIPAQSRPKQALSYITRAIEGASITRGTRGDAHAVAPLILDELERRRKLG